MSICTCVSPRCTNCYGFVFNANKNIDKVDKKPYKCPVCDGSGNHPCQTISFPVTVHKDTGLKICNGCDGKGIVWG